MFAVGKLGSYISRGVYTVSGPFHPFGGAVDIVVVEQPDGTFKSSPWYVRFGKFQGVLKASEKVVSINVNGVDAGFNMCLDHKGEAFFLREVDAEEGDLEPYASSGDEMDVKADLWRVPKSKSCNFDANRSDLVSELESSKIVPPLNNSRRRRLFGLSFGRRSMKENGFQDGEDGSGVDRVSSMERAEMAADLLEVRWTTNLRVGARKLPPSKSAAEAVNHVTSENGLGKNEPFRDGDDSSKVCSSLLDYGTEKSDADIPTSTKPLNYVGIFSLKETCMKDDLSSNRVNNGNISEGKNTRHELSKVLKVDEQVSSSIGSDNQHDHCSLNSDPISLSPVSNKEISSAEVFKAPLSLDAENSIGNSAFQGNRNLTFSNDSEDEQFAFSDLDDQKVDKEVHVEVLSRDNNECPSQDSSERSEDEMTEGDTIHPTNKEILSKVSCPISISNLPIDIDGKPLSPFMESMPDLLFDGDGANCYFGPERLGHSLDSNLEAMKLVNDALVSSESNAAPHQIEHVQLETVSSQISEDIKKIISDPAVELSLCRHLLSEGMGYEAAAAAFDTEKINIDKFYSLGPEIVKNDKLVVRIGGLYFPWDAALPIASAIGSQEREKMLEPRGMIAVGQIDDTISEGATQKPMNSRSGFWWPFLFKRSNSMQGRSVDSEPASESPSVKVDNMDVAWAKPSKRKIRAKAPTSEHLASLKLKEGKNEVTFTFSTAMLGKQQVDARIFLWKWNTRVVISDVDGTITKSDVLGQFMPLMGMDWSQTGVTHLFSAIKENGYQLLFLSARSISQAYHTRQFLFNLKQDGKELPEGPVIISPDGLFPSLYREVIRRAPHEFKISCLEDIKVLFPPDHNPFYAGFGNRDTDEISYLRVGIPMGKIFIINPKGQIAVNRRVDTKSYTSLHSLVHDMFPPAPVSEQEDYNSWNFWRLPPPDVI
ncbi:hypothetical protein RND81_01G087300 [Saponaria officinalis]|uniref:phosphatidate phosphatase n=1 Tax=Saponaria officinalis TaxID=3572 RepID=A0AAW1N982_SAPOF